MVSDVPVGVFLSAGIDSNVIAALAAELGTQLRTVTLAFNEYAERRMMRLRLQKPRRRSCEVITSRCGSAVTNSRSLLDDFLRCMDQPTIDGLNTYLVSRAAAKQGLKVALSGLGGDELFGGYPSFRQIPRTSEVGTTLFISPSLWAVPFKPYVGCATAGHSAEGCRAAVAFGRHRECLSFATQSVSRG